MINLIKRQIYLDSSWIKPKTLVNLRWLAIVGQGVAIAVTDLVLGLTFNVEACLTIILFSCIINLTCSIYFKTEKRLSALKTFLFLSFDLTQISLLLYFSGGISNPFSMLIIVPAVVSASSLPVGYLIALGVMTFLCILLLSFKNFSILDSSGDVLTPPEILLVGFSASLIITVTFLGSYVRRIFLDNSNMNKALQATQVALEKERKLTALTGVVAALGHELGSPLATIKLASSELLSEIDSDSPIYQDIKLIYEQIERCKTIISDMGSLGKDDQYVKIIDFGRANLIHEKSSILVGTPMFMAPEIHDRMPELILSALALMGDCACAGAGCPTCMGALPGYSADTHAAARAIHKKFGKLKQPDAAAAAAPTDHAPHEGESGEACGLRLFSQQPTREQNFCTIEGIFCGAVSDAWCGFKDRGYCGDADDGLGECACPVDMPNWEFDYSEPPSATPGATH